MARRVLAVGILVIVVLVAGFSASRFLLEEPQSQKKEPIEREPIVTDASEQSPAEAKTAVIETVQGRAIRRLPGQAAAPVVKGDRLPAASTVETRGGSVTLTTTGGAQVVVSDESLLRVAEQSREGVDIVLARGRAEAKAQGAAVRMGFEGSDAVAITNDGDFSAVSDGAGQVAVASSRGEVDLTAQGESVRVREGEQSVVRPSMPPSAPTSIPTSFFLKVRKPGATRRPQAKLAGRTAPGSIVNVGDQSVTVGADGKFEATVPLKRGRNAVSVSARDTQGRDAKKDVSIVYKKADPKLRSKVVW